MTGMNDAKRISFADKLDAWLRQHFVIEANAKKLTSLTRVGKLDFKYDGARPDQGRPPLHRWIDGGTGPRPQQVRRPGRQEDSDAARSPCRRRPALARSTRTAGAAPGAVNRAAPGRQQENGVSRQAWCRRLTTSRSVYYT